MGVCLALSAAAGIAGVGGGGGEGSRGERGRGLRGGVGSGAAVLGLGWALSRFFSSFFLILVGGREAG